MKNKEVKLLRNILTCSPIDKMYCRTYLPDGRDILLGFCQWNGKNIISLDGDSYYLDEEITKYEFDEKGNLTYWIVSEWISG